MSKVPKSFEMDDLLARSAEKSFQMENHSQGEIQCSGMAATSKSNFIIIIIYKIPHKVDFFEFLPHLTLKESLQSLAVIENVIKMDRTSIKYPQNGHS